MNRVVLDGLPVIALKCKNFAWKAGLLEKRWYRESFVLYGMKGFFGCMAMNAAKE